MSPELLNLLRAITIVTGLIVCALIRARTAREGHLAGIVREIIRKLRR